MGHHRTLVIPEGYAHGFQTLTDDCELLYLHTAAFQPDAEGALNATDPRLAIAWPLPIAERSARDQAHPYLHEGYVGVDVQTPRGPANPGHSPKHRVQA